MKMPSSHQPYASVYSAELYAIKMAPNIIKTRKLKDDIICSDWFPHGAHQQGSRHL